MMWRKILLTVVAVGAGGAGCGSPDDAPPAQATPGPVTTAGDTAAARRTVLFVGTSLTAGYGLDRDDAYPALLQEKIDSAGLDWRVVNAGVSGATSAEGLSRIDWLLRQPVDALVLELGANDGLRGRGVEQMRENLQAIIDRTRARYPDVRIIIAGMEAPPNLGRRYTEPFRQVFRDLAEANDAVLIPFLLDGVAAEPDLNQADGIHPTADGQRIVAENVWEVVAPLLVSGAW